MFFFHSQNVPQFSSCKFPILVLSFLSFFLLSVQAYNMAAFSRNRGHVRGGILQISKGVHIWSVTLYNNSVQIVTFNQTCKKINHLILVSKGGAVVRALASHQCGLGSNPGVNAICGLSMLLVLSLAQRGCSPSTLVFPLSLKTNTFKFQFDLARTDTFQQVLMNSLVLHG